MQRLLGVLLLLHWSGAAFAIRINTQMPTSSGISVEILHGGTPVLNRKLQRWLA
jgi:hypothetical protein